MTDRHTPVITYTPGIAEDQKHIFTVKRCGGTVEFTTTKGTQWMARRHGEPISYQAACMALGLKNGDQLSELMRQVHAQYVRVLHGEVLA